MQIESKELTSLHYYEEERELEGSMIQENAISTIAGQANSYFDACYNTARSLFDLTRVNTSIKETMQAASVSMLYYAMSSAIGVDQGFLTAAIFNSPALATRFLKAGANINFRNRDGARALENVIYKGNLAMLNFLLDKGVNLDSPSKDKQHLKPIRLAVLVGHSEITKALLAHCPGDIQDIDYRGRTLAMFARGRGFKDLQIDLENLDKGLSLAWTAHKMMAHRFSINLCFTQRNIKLDGFNSSTTYAELCNSLVVHQKNWESMAPKGWNANDTAEVLEALNQSHQLIDIPLNIKDKVLINRDLIDNKIKSFEQGKMLIIPTGWEKHQMVIIISPLGYLIIANRAKILAGLYLYALPEASFPLLTSVIEHLIKEEKQKNNKAYIENLDKLLSLELLHVSSRLPQPADTCTWSSSAKLAFQGALMMQMLKKYQTIKTHYGSKTNSTYSRFEEASVWLGPMYKAWTLHDRLHAIETYIHEIPSSKEKKAVLSTLYQRLKSKEFGQAKQLKLERINKNALSTAKEYTNIRDIPRLIGAQKHSTEQKQLRMTKKRGYKGLEKSYKLIQDFEVSYNKTGRRLIKESMHNLKKWTSKVKIETENVYPRLQKFEIDI